MSLLDASVLNCLFQPRYMTMGLCVRLEPTSGLFAAKADQFYRQIKQVDVEELMEREENINWFRKVYHRCPNLTTVNNVQVTKDNLKRDMICIQQISMIKSVTSFGVKFLDHFSPLAMFPVAGMANVNHVNISVNNVPSKDPSLNIPPMEKLRVTSLTCDALSLLDFCSPDHLNILRFEFWSVDLDELIEKLRSFINLKELEIVLDCPENTGELLPLVNFVSDVLQVDAFSLKLSWMDEEQFLELCDHTNLLKRCVTRLSLYDIRAECVPNILQFAQLRYLFLENVKIPLDILLKSLPNLCHLEASEHNVESSEGDAHFTFKSVFDKRWIYVYTKLSHLLYVLLIF